MERLTVFLTPFLLLLALKSGKVRLQILKDINELDIQLANGSAPHEGRVLIRWTRDSTWVALCFNPVFADTVAFQMCRLLGYPFACGIGEAGPPLTNYSSLENVTSVEYLGVCVIPANLSTGGCSLFQIPLLDPLYGLACTHDMDMWLSCGYAGMDEFELRLVKGPYQYPGLGILQGRCGVDYEWGAICKNWFGTINEGRVACRELGYSDAALSVWPASFDEVDARHKPNYTLFVDTGCAGNETSLTECEHYSLRQCEGYVTLQCFTEINYYDETAYLCGSKQLCGDQCEQQHPIANSTDDIFHYCRCDDACILFGDCCYDHVDMCNPVVPKLERGAFTHDQFGCVWVPGSQFNHIGYVAVNNCPVNWTDEGTRDLCERRVDITDVIGSLPVYDEEGVDFKNIYCAICHGKALDGLKRWDVSGSGNTASPTAAWFYPSLNQALPTKGWVITPPQDHVVIRECPAHLVETCLVEFRGTQMEESCRAYYAPIRIDRSHTRYRNPHCALCNSRHLVPENSCMDQVCPITCDPTPWGDCSGVCSPYDNFFTIEVLFDLSSSSITGVSCFEGQIYDPFLDRCRVLTCTSGYQIKGDECVVANPMSPPIDATDDVLVTECLSERLGKNSTGSKALVAGLKLIDPKSSAWSVSVLVTCVRDAFDIEIAFDHAIELIQNTSLVNSSLLCNISEFSILLPFALEESDYCGREISNQTFLGYSGPLLSVVKFYNTTDGRQYMKEMVSPLCLKIVELNCSSFLTMEDDEYSIVSKNSIEVVATGMIISAAGYVFFPDGRVVVCSFIGPVPEGLEPRVRRAISFAGSLLSLLSLAATFLTYCVFPEIRNTAGKSTMNLVVALFIAILLFLFTGYLRQNHVACVSGAVIAHISWLAAFFWMTLICFNVARTLASKVLRSHRGTKFDWTLIAHMGLAWGIPLVIVSICLILQYCDCTSIPVIYAEGDICWITDRSSRLVVFVVPVAVSLVLDTCLYVFTVISIRRNRQASKAARKQGKGEEIREELTIYAKICALVGVTWIFGFVSQSVTGIIVFSYIYIILNYLQGVFIFIAFCLNKRVRSLWREKLGMRKGRRGKDLTPQSKQNTKTVSSKSPAVGQSNVIIEDTQL